MNNDHKMYLYKQCRRFASANCPEELRHLVEDLASAVFAKALKELPNLKPQDGKTMEDCIEALACLRTIDELKRLSALKLSVWRSALPASVTDTPDESETAFPDDDGDSLERMIDKLDSIFVPEWVRELRRVKSRLWGRDLALANALLHEANQGNGLASHRRVRHQLNMSWREFYTRLGRLRRRFRKAWDLFKDYYTK